MMIAPHTGDVRVPLGVQTVTLRLTWRGVSFLTHYFGDEEWTSALAALLNGSVQATDVSTIAHVASAFTPNPLHVTTAFGVMGDDGAIALFRGLEAAIDVAYSGPASGRVVPRSEAPDPGEPADNPPPQEPPGSTSSEDEPKDLALQSYDVWCYLGFDPAAFWDMTPYQTAKAIEASGRGVRDAHKAAVSAAWHVAAFTRMRELPSHETVMKGLGGEAKQAEEVSPERAVEIMRAVYGGKASADD